MSDIVIKAENLGKKYIIGHQAERGNYTALRDVLMQNARTLWNKTKDLAAGKPITQGDMLEEIWALKDVSFEIRRGEAVGIIGRNGAGKSTLLKILSRITEPSAGRITIKGRISSLLEVGTGFHPELTGRENIFLNGAILGMTKVEIKRKFDEIVNFAEIEKFLDTPVKRYSSGMYVRLAFAVAAHLEPEILVVDEVLAVGDAQFQKKCLGKMEDVGKEGRTVLFVSHNMGAISRLCNQSIWLSNGSVVAIGNSYPIINNYISEGASDSLKKAWELENAPGDNYVKLTKVQITQLSGKSSSTIDISKPTIIEIEIEVLSELSELALGIRVTTLDGQVILHTANVVNNEIFIPSKGKWLLSCLLPKSLLNVGPYALSVGADIPHHRIIFYEENLLIWKVVTASAEMGRYSAEAWKGVIGPAICQWSQSRIC